MTINQLQEQVDTWIRQYGVRYYAELTNVALLMEEVGEFARLVAVVHGEHSFKKESEPKDIKEALADEMGDIFFVLTCLANQMHIDLDKAIERNLVKKTQRDGTRHQDNPKLQ